MSNEHIRQLIRAVCEAALQTAENLTAPAKADIFEGISLMAKEYDEQISTHAGEIAHHLRESEIRQMSFQTILRQL